MKITAILSPRIMLNIQILGEIARDHAALGRSFRLVNFNTGEIDQDTFNTILAQNGLDPQKVPSTTRIDVVNKILAQAQADNVPLIISSTYHSAHKLAELDQPIDLVIHDEAHYLVQPDFHKSLELGKARLSFTATQRTTDSDDGRGMNNTDKYGEVLYTKSPLSLIHAGELVAPAIHIIDVQGTTDPVLDDDYEGMARCIYSAYDEHHDLVQKYSADKTQIAGKLLVTCDGRESLKQIIDLIPTYQATYPDVQVYALASDWGIYLNGQMIPNSDNKAKAQLLHQLRSLAPDTKAIIFHVDMIAEGLDVPGITGVMPIRNLGKIKFLQTLGRAARLHPEDRKNLYANTIKPSDSTKFIKPFAWVIIPRVMANSPDALKRYYEYIDNIRTEYELTPFELTIVDNKNGVDNEEEEGPEYIGQHGAEEDKTSRFTKDQILAFLHESEDPETIALNNGEFWHNDLWTTMLFDYVDQALNHGQADHRTSFTQERAINIEKTIAQVEEFRAERTRA